MKLGHIAKLLMIVLYFSKYMGITKRQWFRILQALSVLNVLNILNLEAGLNSQDFLLVKQRKKHFHVLSKFTCMNEKVKKRKLPSLLKKDLLSYLYSDIFLFFSCINKITNRKTDVLQWL